MVHLTLVKDDRRERAREKKRQRFLDAASRVIDRDGVEGVTMQAVADELDCAVGTIYGYFPSKAALLGALTADAVGLLRGSLDRALPTWDDYLDQQGLDEPLRCLVRLVAFGGFWQAASVVLRDEFELQRSLLSDPIGPREDEQTALASVEVLLEVPRALLDDAAAVLVLDAGEHRGRALSWIAALDGILLLERRSALDRHLFRAGHLCRTLTQDLLVGWGADRRDVDIAVAHVERLAAEGPLAPPPLPPEG
jgi:AcrR family transcriptional regulator